MPLFNLILNIPQEYKNIINKYIEILSIAIIYIILIDADSRSSIIDKIMYIMLGITFYHLIVKKVLKVS